MNIAFSYRSSSCREVVKPSLKDVAGFGEGHRTISHDSSITTTAAITNSGGVFDVGNLAGCRGRQQKDGVLVAPDAQLAVLMW